MTDSERKYTLHSMVRGDHPHSEIQHVLDLYSRTWTLDELNDLADTIKSYCQDQDMIERLY